MDNQAKDMLMVSLPEEMFDHLREIAEEEDISINDLIVHALNEYWLYK